MILQLELFRTPEECEKEAIYQALEDLRKSNEKVS